MITREMISDICKIQEMASDYTCTDFIEAVKQHPRFDSVTFETTSYFVFCFGSVVATVDKRRDCLSRWFDCADEDGEAVQVESEEIVFTC
jgi:hypothetical protein